MRPMTTAALRPRCRASRSFRSLPPSLRLRRRSHGDAVRGARRAGRDHGGRGPRPQLEGAAHVVGRSEPRGRLEHRRHAQRAR